MSQLLDGKTFEGTIRPKEGKETEKETLEFKDGRFRSYACNPHGFGDAEYHAEDEKNLILFEAETVNPQGERMEWGGAFQGDRLMASAINIKKDGSETEYVVEARLKSAAQAA
jgi:hypothetical protein